MQGLQQHGWSIGGNLRVDYRWNIGSDVDRFRTAAVWFGLLLAVLTILEIFTSSGKAFWLFQTDGRQNFGLMASVIDRLGAMTDAERERYLDYCEYWTCPPDDPYIVAQGHNVYSPFYHITDPRALELLHYVHLLVIVLFTVGFCTRVTGVLTWLAALAYIQRNPLTLFGQDTMMNLCMVYLILSPCGAVWSVDWLIARYRAGRAALRGGERPPDAGPRHLISAGFAIRLLQVHYCFMYMSAGLAKLKGEAWWNGTAPFSCMTNPEFCPLHMSYYRDLLVWLCQDSNRWLWEGYMSATTVFTLFTEIGFPFLVWTRMRPVMLTCAILLHTGIALNMGLVVFSLFMFILACNLLGMLPYSFTVTSHIIVTFAFAAMIFIGVTTVAFVRHVQGR